MAPLLLALLACTSPDGGGSLEDRCVSLAGREADACWLAAFSKRPPAGAEQAIERCGRISRPGIRDQCLETSSEQLLDPDVTGAGRVCDAIASRLWRSECWFEVLDQPRWPQVDPVAALWRCHRRMEVMALEMPCATHLERRWVDGLEGGREPAWFRPEVLDDQVRALYRAAGMASGMAVASFHGRVASLAWPDSWRGHCGLAPDVLTRRACLSWRPGERPRDPHQELSWAAADAEAWW